MLTQYKIKTDIGYYKKEDLQNDYKDSDREIVNAPMGKGFCGKTEKSTGLSRLIFTDNPEDAWIGLGQTALQNINMMLRRAEYVNVGNITLEEAK